MELLLDCVGRESNHLPAALLLGAMALLEGDAETLEAVVDDLETTREDAELGDADRRKIQQLLVLVAALPMDKKDADEKGETNGDSEAPRDLSRAIAEAQVSTALFPALPHGWHQLAALSGGVGSHPAQMALKTAQHAVPPRGFLAAEDLAEAFAAAATAADAQCAVMVAPWVPASWRGVADAVSRSEG
jgi:superkiller protein 3